MVLEGREQKSLSQLGCTDKQTWIVKPASGASTVLSGAQLTEVQFLHILFRFAYVLFSRNCKCSLKKIGTNYLTRRPRLELSRQ